MVSIIVINITSATYVVFWFENVGKWSQ